MTIQTKLTFEKYLKLVYSLTYRRPLYIIISIIGLISLSSGLFQFLNPDFGFSKPYAEIIWGLIVVIVVPILIYFQSKRNYNSTKRLGERITYEFNHDTIKITGESFNSEMSWDKTYKIRALNNWILIYHNNIAFNIIQKSDFGENIDEFKKIVFDNNIKNNF